MKTVEITGWALVFLGFGLGFVRTVWVTLIAASKAVDDWKPLDRKAVSDLEPLWAKRIWHLGIILMVLGVMVAVVAKQ